MADLVAEVSDQRAIGLAQILPDLLAPGVVGFLDVQGDQAAGMAGHHDRPAGRRAQKVEGHAVLWILVDLGFDREAQREELGDQSPLGLFDGPQVTAIVRVLHVRNGAVQATGDARR